MKNEKIKTILTWAIQVILGLQFILSGQAKFTRADWWSRKFSEWGYPDNFYLVIGVLELVGGI